MALERVSIAILLAGSVSSFGCDVVPAEGPERGRVQYVYCVQCHGEDGGGNEAFKAPAIAGLDAWYVEAQLRKFKDGARGDHPDDVDGLRMRPMSRTLRAEGDIPAMAAYVASMTPIDPPPTVEGGDPNKGKNLFAACSACHGLTAEGKKELNGPPLQLMNDWYMIAQLKKFKAGIRGTDTLDATGAQMRPMATTLATEQDIKDVVAYIMTLQR